MSVPPINEDTVGAMGVDGDGKGQSALLLVESLIHGLLAASVINVTQAVEIVESAIEVQRATLLESDTDPVASSQVLAALEAISQSLRLDLA